MDIKHCIHIYVHIQELGRKFPLLLINTLLLKKTRKETQKFFSLLHYTQALLHLTFLKY